MSRKRARDATPSDEGNDISTNARQSSEQTDALTRLTEVMSDILKNSGSRRESNTVRGDVIPIFDPEDRNQEITAWCQKVDELKLIFGWSEEATIYFALGRLSGLAEEAFPYKKDFCELLNEMQRRRKRPDETYTKYYYEKCVLLNSCKIQGTDAVSCLIGGIDDNVVKTDARAGKHQTPESLHEFLNTDDKILKFVKSDTKLIQDIEVEPPIRKIVLRVRKETTVPHDHLANVQVYCKDYKGDLFVEARVCLKEGQEYLLPNTVLRVSTDGVIAIPCINLSDGNLNFHQDTIFARAWPCVKQRNDSTPKEFDRMRPWIPVGGVSSGKSEESSDEGVVFSDPDEPDVSHREAR
ncbi:hypothetical protein RN001_015009 [Aquatica leii]|uniref:Uncharacterized protein n=1 Tax=Aquatica leii TaxID=1421715 RepID=A0AAN7NV62_9COLE|nr:hypothetical protein RN001_015009 [Aquatica leii]